MPAQQHRKSKSAVKATHDLLFRRVHGSNLIYNCAWEDPRIDRELLELNQESTVVMITSAGCNTLDYLLDDPRSIHSVDVNYRQNALLELKMALITRENFDDLFEMFGIGSHIDHERIYAGVRDRLSLPSRQFWDKKIGFFNPQSFKRSFYYHGTSGLAAWVMGNALFKLRPNIGNFAESLLDCRTLEEQCDAFATIESTVSGRFSNWLFRQPALMTLLGVPRPQINLIQATYPGGLAGYVTEKLKHVMTQVPISDNYFWRIYITGSYTLHCCPNYLRRENQDQLAGRTGRIKPHTGTITNFLRENPGDYSHYILLDHQDWLAWNDPAALLEEWDLILKNSRPGTRILMRSASPDLSFIPSEVLGRLAFQPERTSKLHLLDRVGTYGSTHLAEVIA